jgi:hypothetical protein
MFHARHPGRAAGAIRDPPLNITKLDVFAAWIPALALRARPG